MPRMDLEHGRYLYHYTSAQTLSDFIGPSMQLRMSPMSAVNDPRESKMWEPALVKGGGFLPDGMEYGDFVQAFNLVTRQRTKILCFTRDDPGMTDASPPDLYAWGYAHSHMWDRYADLHRGVCLVLDIDILGDEIAGSVASRGELMHQGVSYHNYPPEGRAFQMDTAEINSKGLAAALLDHRELHHGVFYFYKAVDWQSENEYRWVLFSDHDDEWEYASVQDSLVGVIFGVDCSPADEKRIRWVLRTHTPRYGRMLFRNGHPILLSES